VEFQLIEVMKMEMQMIQFDSIVNLIKTKLVKVIYKMRNILIQKFQHFVEFRLIQVMKMRPRGTSFSRRMTTFHHCPLQNLTMMAVGRPPALLYNC
jgi:hypothetical protein